MYASRVDLTWAGWTQFGERRGQHGLSRTTATAAEASCPWCEATTSLLISSPLSSAHQQPPHRNNVFIRYQPLSSAHYQPLRINPSSKSFGLSGIKPLAKVCRPSPIKIGQPPFSAHALYSIYRISLIVSLVVVLLPDIQFLWENVIQWVFECVGGSPDLEQDAVPWGFPTHAIFVHDTPSPPPCPHTQLITVRDQLLPRIYRYVCTVRVYSV